MSCLKCTLTVSQDNNVIRVFVVPAVAPEIQPRQACKHVIVAPEISQDNNVNLRKCRA